MTKTEIVGNFRRNRKENAVYVMGGKCQMCGYDECAAAMDFHHINPDEKELKIGSSLYRSWDLICNELKKCALLCANCHRKYHALNLSIKFVSPFDEVKAEQISKGIVELRTKHYKTCKICGKTIDDSSCYCKQCYDILQQKQKRPSRDELKLMIRNMPIQQIANQYNVSWPTIKKWCLKYGLPGTKKEINSYNNTEWKTI